MFISNLFKGGAPGATVTVLNSDDNGSGNAFSGVVGDVKYLAPRPGTGRGATLTATAAQAKVRWSGSDVLGTIASGNVRYDRSYRRIAAYPSAPILLNQWRDAVVPGNSAQIRLKSDGFIDILDSAGTISSTSSSAIPLNKVIRIESKVTFSASVGQIEVRFYWNDGVDFHGYNSKIPSMTMVTAATINTRGTADEVNYGIASSNPSYSMEMYGLAVSDTGWIGPFDCPTKYILLGSWIPMPQMTLL